MASPKQLKTKGTEQNALLRARLGDLQAELEITKAAFKDELFDWAASAISAFLKGKSKTLDAAFKTSTGGRPSKSFARSDEEARAIARERLAGLKWEAIATQHGMKPRQALREYHRGIAILGQDEVSKSTADLSAALLARLAKADTIDDEERAARTRRETEARGIAIVGSKRGRRRVK